MNCALETGGRGVAGDCWGLRAEVWDTGREGEQGRAERRGGGRERWGEASLAPQQQPPRGRGRPRAGRLWDDLRPPSQKIAKILDLDPKSGISSEM